MANTQHNRLNPKRLSRNGDTQNGDGEICVKMIEIIYTRFELVCARFESQSLTKKKFVFVFLFTRVQSCCNLRCGKIQTRLGISLLLESGPLERCYFHLGARKRSISHIGDTSKNLASAQYFLRLGYHTCQCDGMTMTPPLIYSIIVPSYMCEQQACADNHVTFDNHNVTVHNAARQSLCLSVCILHCCRPF